MDLIRWRANERVGLPDQDAMSDLVLEAMVRKNRDLVLPDTVAPKVFGGFGLSGYTPLGTVGTATLAYGRAIMKLQKDQTLSHGFFLGLQSPASYLLDFTAAGNDTYNVYVRAVYSDADFENRVFWNAGTTSEYIDYTATRRRVTWEVTYQSSGAASPGSEWMLVWQITVAANLITAVTDKRDFYFEGDPSSYSHQWGDGTNDRNSDRAQYGVKDRWTWDQALRRQIADIIGSGGPTQWWLDAPISLTALNTEHYGPGGSEGLHQLVTLGPVAQRHRFDSVNLNKMRIRMLDQASLAEIQWEATGIGSSLAILPRGAGNNLSDGDSFVLLVGNETGTPDFRIDMNRIAFNQFYFDFWTGAANPASIYGGAGYAYGQLGIHVNESLASFFVTELTRNMMIPLDIFQGNWSVNGTVDVTAGNVRLESTASGDEAYVEIRSFPEGATLTKIQILWEQDLPSTGARDMRMYACRHTQPAGHQTDGDIAAGTQWTRQTLKGAGNQYIEYVQVVTTANVMSFTPDQNNANWSKENDKLVLGLWSGDDASRTYNVHSIRLYWTYKDINFYPVDT